MKLKIFLTTLTIVFSCGLLSGQDLSGIPGAFVDIGFGAKPVGLGGAFVGLADDVNSVIWNPAGLSNVHSKQVSFTYTRQLNLINYHYLAAAMPLSSESGIGIAVIGSGDKALREYTLQTSYGQKLYNFYVGASFKVRFATFGNNKLSESDYVIFEPDEISEGLSNQVKGDAFGVGLDLGLLYKIQEKVTVGLLLKDIYSPVYWNSSNDNPVNKPQGSYDELVPFEAILGSSIHIIDELLVTADYAPAIYEDANNKFRGGVQGNIFNVVFLRAGFQQFLNDVEDEKYSLGLGLKIGTKNLQFAFDYTYMIEELSNTQRLSLSIEF